MVTKVFTTNNFSAVHNTIGVKKRIVAGEKGE